jgi:hypothetical protein
VATADKEGRDTPLAVNFSSAGSAGLDGVIASYLWNFGDGSTSPVANPSHTYAVPGKYVATLTVTDKSGCSYREHRGVGSNHTVPPAPTNLTAVVQSKTIGWKLKTRVKLDWMNNATSESGYLVERCSNQVALIFTPIATLPANSVRYYDKAVTGATTYRYRTAATSSGGQSPYSNVAGATIP